jgi:APA family basic amino acid/polyamine antiporter
MLGKQLLARKSIERLLKEMAGEHRLRRVLGVVGLTSLGIGAIIGSGIFVATGEAAANKAGPAVMISFVVAGLGCALAALCYAEFASLAPVAGSAYTYAYATLGEMLAWIIGWDLVLEYAMSCATLAADWTKYFNQLLEILFNRRLLDVLSNDMFTVINKDTGATGWLNLPAVILMALCTAVLVIGIRESVTTNAILVGIKLGVVLFVIGVGCWYINPTNWTGIPVEDRKVAYVGDIERRWPDVAKAVPRSYLGDGNALVKMLAEEQVEKWAEEDPQIKDKLSRGELSVGKLIMDRIELSADDLKEIQGLGSEEKRLDLLKDKLVMAKFKLSASDLRDIKGLKSEEERWGMLGFLGVNRWLSRYDENSRTPFMPYGWSGIMVAAAAVFFAYIGFDSISTHAEEARKPQRDVPAGILASLGISTVLYFGVAAVITGMQPYPQIDPEASVSVAFKELAKEHKSVVLGVSAALITAGVLAGITSVILITFLSQARIFLAMARDGLLPPSIFGAVHPRFRTPHRATILTGAVLCVVTAVTPIHILFNMVNIGTLLAFIIVCAAVLLLRIRRPDAQRPFRCPAVYVIAPLGIVVNLLMMLFLPVDTWLRLVGWLVLGLCIYFGYSARNSVLGREMRGETPPMSGV